MAEEGFVEQGDHLMGPSKTPQGKRISSGQRLMAYNLYIQWKQDKSKSAAIKLASKQLGLVEATVWNIVKEMESTGTVGSPPKKRQRTTTCEALDEWMNYI